MSLFKKATKNEAKLRLAIAGPSGSGKTYTALSIASGLGGPIAFVDTEHGSASKYADIFSFDVLELHAPYHPDKYIEAIAGAAQAGYKVVILDSISHAWNGTGGLLELVEQAAKRMKTPNSYTAWGDVTPIQNRFIESIVSASIHVIATMRSKQAYVQNKDNNGRTVISKQGMEPIQRDSMEYEFDIFLEMNMDNDGLVGKTRCPEMTGKVYAKPGKQVAAILSEWLSGEPVKAEGKPDNPFEEVEFANVPPKLSAEQFKHLHAVGTQLYGTDDWDVKRPALVQWVSKGAITSSRELSPKEADRLIDVITKKIHEISARQEPIADIQPELA
jgi:hypothetical protein